MTRWHGASIAGAASNRLFVLLEFLRLPEPASESLQATWASNESTRRERLARFKSDAVQIAYPVLYGLIIVFSFIELVLSSYLVGDYNSCAARIVSI